MFELRNIFNQKKKKMCKVLIELLQIFFVEDSNSWLCGGSFTIADVSLGVLLHRLQQLGLEKHFWGKNKKPYISKYFARIVKRKSFENSLPSKTATIKAAWAKLPYSYKICAVSIPTVVIAILFYKV